MTTHLETDFCVVGGGMSGVCASLAAARNGARVVLVQDRSVLGGNASSEIRMHIVGASCSGRRPLARESGIIDEIRVADAVHNSHRSPALFDLLLYDLVRREPNITLLLDTAVVGCEADGPPHARRIKSVYAECNASQTSFSISARFFADCSGDSRLGLEAGADYRVGREAKDEYGESNAQEQADACTLGSTVLLTARDMGRPVPFVPPPWARRFTEEDLKFRSHREREYGYWWAEWGGQLDTVKDNDRIRHELVAIALGIWDHVKNHCTNQGEDPAGKYEKWMAGQSVGTAGAQNWALDWVGMLPGKRESRRLLGPHVICESDILSGRVWPDQVAYGGWWIDLHPPAGVDAVHEYPCQQIEVPHLYSIPLQALFSRNVGNLFMAGRNVSATHVAFASTRVMATCAAMGQAVGTAAAIANRVGCEIISDLLEPSHLGQLQQTLLRDDAFLLEVVANDREDLARRSTITATDELPGNEAQLLVNGVTRRLTRDLHPSFPDSSNEWVSKSLPASVDLRWDQPQVIDEIHLTFDTGFERELTLSMSEAFTNKMIRGPQPETVADYTISTPWWSLSVEGNYQRKRVHKLAEALRTDRLRLTVHRTHGCDQARVFEVRIYNRQVS